MHCTKVLQLSVASIRLPMNHISSFTCCQYQSTDAPQYCSYLLPVSAFQFTAPQYLIFLLPVSVYQCNTVLQLFVASISLPLHHILQFPVASIILQMHHSTSVTCCQYQSTNSPQYFSYLLLVSVYQFTTVFLLPVASISLRMHHSTSDICCQYKSKMHNKTSVIS